VAKGILYPPPHVGAIWDKAAFVTRRSPRLHSSSFRTLVTKRRAAAAERISFRVGLLGQKAACGLAILSNRNTLRGCRLTGRVVALRSRHSGAFTETVNGQNVCSSVLTNKIAKPNLNEFWSDT
jgi:hypothetical protein